MTKLSSFSSRLLTNDSYLSYVTRIRAVILDNAELASSKFGHSFCEASSNYEDVLTHQEEIAKPLEDFDRACDRAWSALNAVASAMTFHHDPKRADAASEIIAVISSFGNPIHLGYDKEYAIIAQLLAKLEEIDSALFELAHCDDLVNQLRVTYNAFMTARQNETQRRADRANGSVKDARNATEESCKRLFNYINLAVIDDISLNSCVDHINQIIAEIKAARKANATRKETARAKQSVEE